MGVFKSFTLDNNQVGSRHVPEKERIEIFSKYFPDESIQENQWVQSGENNEMIIPQIHEKIMEKYDIEKQGAIIQQIREILIQSLSTIEQLHRILHIVGIYTYKIQAP